MSDQHAGTVSQATMADPATWQKLPATLAAMLEHHRIVAVEGQGLLVLGAEEAEAVLRAPEAQSLDLLAAGGISTGPLHDWWSQVMFSADPPEHTRLRRLANRAFTPRQAARNREWVEELTHDLLRPHLSAGRIDLVEDVAHHLPIRVMGRLLAIPDDDYEIFSAWTADLGLVFSAIVDQEARGRLERTIVAFGAYVEELIARRRSERGDDLLSELIAAEQDGERLSSSELVAMVQNLLFAGHDTTRSLMMITLATLLQHPDEAAALLAQPERVTAVVEEVLRFEPPVAGTARLLTSDVVTSSGIIAGGQAASVSLVAANRDPRRYVDADHFRPDRWLEDPTPPTVLSFGHGIHFCLGAALARMEVQIAVPIVLRTLKHLRLDAEPYWTPYAAIRRFESLPATFDIEA